MQQRLDTAGEAGAAAPQAIGFGPFRLDPAARRLFREGRAVPLGNRAFGLLLLLVERAGEVVGKEELLERAWGSVHVEEENLRVHIHALRKALGDSETQRYVVNIPGRGYSFVALVGQGGAAPQTAEPPRPKPVASSTGLRPPPQRRTAVLGRAEQVAELAEALLGHRLISVVGPGGIGKTTAALAVAAALADRFPGAVAFVDLAPLREERMVQSAVATALNLPIRSEDETGNILAALQDAPVLLVLDNCEHVLDGVATLAEAIHERAPRACILATTREPLCIRAERVHRLPPLPCPPEGGDRTAAEVATYPAAALFVERAAAGAAGFVLTDGNAPVVAEICRRLDGLALAIELAAGRIDSFGVKGLAAGLDQRFQLLSRGRRTALPRQQTLRLALDWSYDLLTEEEKVVLRRLSLFAGSSTLDAAEAVVCGDDIPPDDFTDHLARLVLASLVSADTASGNVRYALLETTRVYALERLAEKGERGVFARRHALHFLNVLQRFLRERPAETLLPFRPDLDNIRAALAWAFSPEGDLSIGMPLSVAAAFLFIDLSLLAECVRWTGLALERLPNEERGTVREMELRTGFAMPLLFTRGNLEEVRLALERALGLAEKLGAVAHQARILDGLFTYHLRGGHFRAMFDTARRAEALTRSITLPNYGGSDWMMGVSHYFAGNLPETRRHLVRAMATLPRKRPVDVLRIGVDQRVNAANALARALWMQGMADQAREVAACNVEETEALGDPVTLAVALMWTLPIALWTGEVVVAERRLARLEECTARGGLSPSRLVGQAHRGAVLTHRGRPAEGIPLLEGSLSALRGINSRLLEVVLMIHLSEAYAAAGRHGAALAEVEAAIFRSQETAELVNLPHLLHLRALYAWNGDGDTARLVAGLDEALAHARGNGALAYELRILTSMARLPADAAARARGLEALHEVHGRFEEGFDTPDLREAGRVLEG
ncbi:ATP-binding protein [Pararoseomonas indoligenes]|uniref:Winged helix-turn-helix domain-containing protein n=1 Tax=Roseomonas indoligenes TaxID=2820811 RepID=A0A940MVS6_9PROT|nr:winged helix-turn-helix domain-containing protein [Pararoseomonas indoligenes]MBP0495108.1 winged helix-turn-helix domain-containing protein [Pararoseomonas indoligenes]